MSEGRTKDGFVRGSDSVGNGQWKCAASGVSFLWNTGTWEGALELTAGDVGLRIFQEVIFVKYVTFREKQACLPEPVFNNSCCGRLQVRFPVIPGKKR